MNPPRNVSPWTLRVTAAGSPPREVTAEVGLSIGRHPDCDLSLTDSRVSAWHARIVTQGADLAIMDLGSNNGTCINGGEVLGRDQARVLTSGMRIQVGHTEILVIGALAAAETIAASEKGTFGQVPLGTSTVWAPADDIDDGEEPGEETRAAPEGEAPARPAHAAYFATAQPVAVPPPTPPPTPLVVRPPKPAQPVLGGEASTPVGGRSPAPGPVAPAQPRDFAAFDSVELNTIVANGELAFGAQAKLSRIGARFVLLNEADLRIVPVSDIEFTIGRSSDSNIKLGNRGVSSDHARVVFIGANNLFMIEDLGSANGTQINGAPLVRHSPRELDSDTHVRFGTVEAVFLRDVDTDLHELPRSRHDNAAKLLKARGQVSASVIQRATKEAAQQAQTLGEALLLGQHVNPREWCRAVEDARLASTVAHLQERSSTRWWALLLFLLLALAAVAVVFAVPEAREYVKSTLRLP